MFVIVTYDVNRKRDAKILKICRKYLTHRQRSVFEGMITEAKLEKLKREIESCIQVTEDTVCIYKFGSLRYTSCEEIGIVTKKDNIL